MGETLALTAADPGIWAAWRSVARRIADLAGQGDRERGARACLSEGADNEALSGFFEGVRRVVTGDNERCAVRRGLFHHLHGVAFEAVVGLKAARRLCPTRQEAASRLERPVQVELGRILERRDRPVHNSRTFEMLVAQARRAVSIPDPGREEPTRSLDFIDRAIEGHVRAGNALLAGVGKALRLVVVPMELPSGGNAGEEETTAAAWLRRIVEATLEALRPGFSRLESHTLAPS
jgi:hypothetical protein